MKQVVYWGGLTIGVIAALAVILVGVRVGVIPAILLLIALCVVAAIIAAPFVIVSASRKNRAQKQELIDLLKKQEAKQ